MASADAPDAPAAMSVDRQAEGAGALLGSEEDIDDNILSNLLSASWLTPPVVDEDYGRYPWTTLGVSLVEQRFDFGDSRQMASICTTIQRMYVPLHADREGTGRTFPFSAIGRTGGYSNCLGTWRYTSSFPRWGTSPTSPRSTTRGIPLSWERRTADVLCRGP